MTAASTQDRLAACNLAWAGCVGWCTNRSDRSHRTERGLVACKSARHLLPYVYA